MNKALRLAVWTATGIVGLQQAALPPPQVTFRGGVDLLQVEVSVLDQQRKPVHDLTAADFEVRVDDKVVPLAAFSVSRLPPPVEEPRTLWMRDTSPDVATNRISDEGRLITIFFDWSIAQTRWPKAREIATAAVRNMGPGDLAAVVYVGQGVPQGFTSDRNRLLATIERPSPAWVVGGATASSLCRCGTCSHDAIVRVAEALQDVLRRRKVLLFIGSSISFQGLGECSLTMKLARESVFLAVARTGLTVHTIDPAGLLTLQPTAEDTGASAQRTGIALAEMQRQANLGLLPDRTGGTFVNSNFAEQEVTAVLAESASYYALGIRPPTPRRDGRDHRVRIAIKRRNLTVVQAERFHGGTRGPAPALPASMTGETAELFGAMTSVWPTTALPLTVWAAPFARPGAKDALIAVALEGQRKLAAVARSDGAAQKGGIVSALVGAFDRDGRVVATREQTVSLSATDEGASYELLLSLTVAPGRYEVRASVADAALALRGSVYTYVEVPDFTEETVWLSDLVIGVPPSAGAGDAIALDGELPLRPTARRSFSDGRRVSAFARVHQGRDDAPRDVEITSQIVDRFDNVIVAHKALLGSAAFARSRSADYLLPELCRDCTAGEYLLRIQARLDRSVVTRTARFTVK